MIRMPTEAEVRNMLVEIAGVKDVGNIKLVGPFKMSQKPQCSGAYLTTVKDGYTYFNWFDAKTNEWHWGCGNYFYGYRRVPGNLKNVMPLKSKRENLSIAWYGLSEKCTS